MALSEKIAPLNNPDSSIAHFHSKIKKVLGGGLITGSLDFFYGHSLWTLKKRMDELKGVRAQAAEIASVWAELDFLTSAALYQEEFRVFLFYCLTSGFKGEKLIII